MDATMRSSTKDVKYFLPLTFYLRIIILLGFYELLGMIVLADCVCLHAEHDEYLV